MASIFTYEADPPRVSSPWLALPSSGRASPADRRGPENGHSGPYGLVTSLADPDLRLEAEPQEGPTEYKLHLLLRPRTSIATTSITRRISEPQKANRGSPVLQAADGSESPSSLATSSLARQNRLEQLTTQLLWRLQQSSSHHSASANKLVLPALPHASRELRAPETLAKLLPGLEESNGALYEIGVSDDGTLVGITSNEMEESLTNLRAMAASLGCAVEVKRMVCVGDDSVAENQIAATRAEAFYVAEAYVKPVLDAGNSKISPAEARQSAIGDPLDRAQANAVAIPQLRVTLTGSTTCGKSSLLGTLSTSTLDNGRGTSRLSLLKHRHEIASGVTSSVAQELVGYQKEGADEQNVVLNYAHENIETWSDIQAAPNVARLTLLSDSAGHPRFRRTTVRGLVGWAPHWTFLCIAANEDHSHIEAKRPSIERGETAGEFSGANAHLSMAHLELCLKLDLPLVVVITKFDEAARLSLRQLLSSLLTRLKSHGRVPVLMSNDSRTLHEEDLQTVTTKDQLEVERLVQSMGASRTTVPILFTSAVKGTGISQLHALLSALPTGPSEPPQAESNDDTSTFHIDDSFDLPVSNPNQESSPTGLVVSGYAGSGSIAAGESLKLGPFAASSSTRHATPSANVSSPPSSVPHESFLEPRSFSDALARTTSSPRLRPSDPVREWLDVIVVSIRNLRLPVRVLQADQVGTIGIVPVESKLRETHALQVRKGMVLARGSPSASHTFTARFAGEEATSVTVGAVVVVYCRSVRAGARVVAVALEAVDHASSGNRLHGGSDSDDSISDSVDDGGAFTFEDHEDITDNYKTSSREHCIRVTFQFVACKEHVQVASQVLIMPEGGAMGSKGSGVRALVGALEGFAGTIVEVFG